MQVFGAMEVTKENESQHCQCYGASCGVVLLRPTLQGVRGDRESGDSVTVGASSDNGKPDQSTSGGDQAMADKLGLKEARAIVDAMLEAAVQKRLNFAVAVVDAGGDIIELSRTDGASALNARMSYNKAYTATKWRQDTRVIKERLFDMSLGNERREITWFCDPLYTPVWGGIVLRAGNGTMLGALGESGGTYQQDEEIGQLGAKVFAAC